MQNGVEPQLRPSGRDHEGVGKLRHPRARQWVGAAGRLKDVEDLGQRPTKLMILVRLLDDVAEAENIQERDVFLGVGVALGWWFWREGANGAKVGHGVGCLVNVSVYIAWAWSSVSSTHSIARSFASSRLVRQCGIGGL